MRLYLLRHGQTTSDIENRFGGDYDDELTDTGRQQSRALAFHLLKSGITRMYTSPKKRAQETAGIIAHQLNVPLDINEDLRERNSYGILTGMTHDEAKEKYAQLVQLTTDYRNTITGGESYGEFKERAMKCFNSLTWNEAEVVALVTHGGFIRMVYREILGKGEITIDDCAYVEIQKDGRDYLINHSSGININNLQHE